MAKYSPESHDVNAHVARGVQLPNRRNSDQPGGLDREYGRLKVCQQRAEGSNLLEPHNEHSELGVR